MKQLLFVVSVSVLACGRVGAQQTVTLNPNPSRVLGHAKLELVTTAPNLVEGRELNNPGGIAVDTTANPPILYVADTGNSRVLGWRDARTASGSAADIVIGQRDFFTTFPQGPGSGTTGGLFSPTGLAVDRSGNLFVIDSGNNRILRFPKPFDQPDPFKTPDLVIGQRSLTARLPNQGEANPNERTIALNAAGLGVFRATLAFDRDGNLWFADPINHRVLRYPASALGPSATNEPAADIVIGQFDFVSRQPLTGGGEARFRKDGLNVPSGVAFDEAGRLYVSDALQRILVYTPPLRTGAAAARILGISRTGQGVPPTNETTLSLVEGIFTIGNTPFAVDTGAHRILRYDPFEQWPAESPTAFSPPAKAVFGQPELVSSRPNRGRFEPGDSGFSLPIAATFANGELFVVDSGNHRVLVLPEQGGPGNFGPATRVQGQATFSTTSPNFIDGREFFFALGTQIGGANVVLGGSVVVDSRSSPPALFVADTYNNRVLGFRDARRVRPGDRADLVIGQTDLFRSLPNQPGFDPERPTDVGLNRPVGLALDSEGNLWVADSGNGRVLRFPPPFAESGVQRANLVLGQSSFTTKITDATRTNMGTPTGLAFTPSGHLLVSDIQHNRVLLFLRPPGGFSSGAPASSVFGQPDFNSSAAGVAFNRFRLPLYVATDTDDRLYVSDSGNARILIYNRAPTAGNDPSPALTLTSVTSPGDRLGSPHGIFVNDRTGEIWVADPGSRRLIRYPKFNDLIVNPVADGGFGYASVVAPFAVVQDGVGNLVVLDTSHRLAMHFPTMAAINGANFLTRPLAPGMIASLFASGGGRFGDQTASFSALPLPRELADIQLIIDDNPVPLFFVSPTQINFQMPMSAPQTGSVEAQVVRRSTGEILAAGTFRMDVAAPGLFTANGSGAGQVSALNPDNTPNGPTAPISRGQVLTLFGTGQGFVPNAPPDGEAPTGPIPTPDRPDVIIGTRAVSPDDILYSGLAPGLVGVWQINVRIPDFVAPSNSVVVVITTRSIPSNQDLAGRRIVTTIAVRQ